MKVHIDVECTPEEARALFGLPDVRPMQQALMQQIEAKVERTLQATEPEALLKMWLPASLQGLEQWQKLIWSAVSTATGRGGGGKPEK